MNNTNSRDKMLDKVRGLLAKAESTEHEAEAEAFFAKAYELIQTYAIDETDLRDAGGDDPIDTEKVWLPEPYSRAKVEIAFALSRHLGCYVVYDSHILDVHRDGQGRLTQSRERGRNIHVTGTATNREAFKLVLTSLLTQCAGQVLRINKKYIQEHAEDFAVRRTSYGESYLTLPSTKTARDQFIVGFGRGVQAQLRTASKDENTGMSKPGALALRDAYQVAQDEYLDGNRVGTGNSKSGNRAGRAAGKRADVGRPRVGGRKALNR